MIILVDQDGPLANWELGFLNEWRRRYPDRPFVPLEDRTTFYVSEDYPDRWKSDAKDIYHSPGFYRNLPLIEGAKEALHKMLELGHEVRICTAPMTVYNNCVLEKYEWVEKHLGMDFVKKIMLMKDKTLALGHYLIDDRPHIDGFMEKNPFWAHVLFDYPYNRSVANKPRLDWSNWREVLPVNPPAHS